MKNLKEIESNLRNTFKDLSKDELIDRIMNKELQDKAWAVLPKEFREEVKKEWKSVDNVERLTHDAFLRGKYSMLTSLFGEHNLTSDTETEEMLIISRKAAEEFYDKYFGKRLCEVNRSSMRYAINALFGGKCRVGEDDVIETKPKFKVGDKVKILSDGRTGTITSIKESPAPYFVIWDNIQGITGGYLTESDIELYTEEKKFLVGEKVIISDDPRIGKDFRGRIGTVAFINSTDQRTVDVGDGVFDCFHISHLEPYIEPKQENTLFSENVKNENNGNHIVENENKQPENDKKDLNLSVFVSPIEKQYHIMVAAEAMKGMLANTNIIMSCGDLEDNQEYITKHAVEYADALIKEINGEGGVLNGIIIDGKVYEAVSNGSRHCSDCDCYKDCYNEPLKYAGICMGFNSQNKVIFRFSKELTDKIK